MLEFTDAPYQFFPSKPSVPIIALSRWVNRKFILGSKRHGISQIDVQGATDRIAELRKTKGAHLLFIANHPTHSDPQTFTEIQRQLGVTSCCMAAYDVFLRSKLSAWIMQRNGAFSIDRESSDRKAMGAAVDILKAGRYGLTIFPEGNVHFTNDRVTPMLDGASFIAIRAQKALGENQTVFAIPVAMKFSHLTDVREKVRDALSELASSVGEEMSTDEDPIEALMRIGRIILVRNLTQRGFIEADEGQKLLDSSCLFESLNASALRIVSKLEQKIGIASKSDSLSQERIRKVRSAIHQVLSNSDRQIDHRAAQGWADEAILVLRIMGYGTPYALENPTLDRFAETVEKLNEDLYNRSTPEPFGKRAAFARVGDPINVSTIVSSGGKKSRNAVSSLTAALESSIQSSLDEINASLSTPGSKSF